MSVANPLVGHAVDDAIRQLSTILTTAADGAEVISDLRTYFQTPAFEDEMVKQAINLYSQVRVTSSAEAALITDAKGQL